MRYTPGPWTCFYKRKYNEWRVSLPDGDSSMRIGFSVDTNYPEGDAHLIAAAPEMLETLNDVFYTLMKTYGDKPKEDIPKSIERVFNRVEALLTRIEGEDAG